MQGMMRTEICRPLVRPLDVVDRLTPRVRQNLIKPVSESCRHRAVTSLEAILNQLKKNTRGGAEEQDEGKNEKGEEGNVERRSKSRRWLPGARVAHSTQRSDFLTSDF